MTTDQILRGVRQAGVAFFASLAGVLLVASIALNFANVVGRYFFNSRSTGRKRSCSF